MPNGPAGVPENSVAAMAAVDYSLVRGIQNLERWHDRTGGERLDLDLPAGELVDALGEHLEVVLQRQARRPGGLEFEILHSSGRGLLLRAGRNGEGCRDRDRDERKRS